MKRIPSIPLRMTGGVDPAYEKGKIHQAGAERHRGAWLAANERAVTVAHRYMDPSDKTVSEFLPLAVLRILDGVKFDRGLIWDKESKTWKDKPAA